MSCNSTGTGKSHSPFAARTSLAQFVKLEVSFGWRYRHSWHRCYRQTRIKLERRNFNGNQHQSSAIHSPFRTAMNYNIFAVIRAPSRHGNQRYTTTTSWSITIVTSLWNGLILLPTKAPFHVRTLPLTRTSFNPTPIESHAHPILQANSTKRCSSCSGRSYRRSSSGPSISFRLGIAGCLCAPE